MAVEALRTMPSPRKPHFFAFFSADLSSERLKIPERFMIHMEGRSFGLVALYGPSGNTWNVDLVEHNGDLFFHNGWTAFVRDHSLECGDFLIFRYDGELRFTVQIFDQTVCEKEGAFHCQSGQSSSYFEKLVGRKRAREEGIGHDVVLCEESTSSGQTKPSPGLDVILYRAKAAIQYNLNNLNDRVGMPALEVAQSFSSSNPYFLRVMKSFNISGSYTLNIPYKFSVAHLPNCKVKIVLSNLKGESWTVNSVPSTRVHTSHTLCGGWMAFVRYNDLKLGDICIFELVRECEFLVHIQSGETSSRVCAGLASKGLSKKVNGNSPKVHTKSLRKIEMAETRKHSSTSTSISKDAHGSQSKQASKKLDSSTGMNGGFAPALPSKSDIGNKSSEEEIHVLPTSSMDHGGQSKKSMDKVEEIPKSSSDRENGVPNLPAPSFLKDPKNRRQVSRPPEVVEARSDIPIIMMEQEIMEAINENSTVIICGETGCGKTTQVPQFLYEVGIGSNGCPLGSGVIGVSQPRRIAVYATASRVAYELGVQVGEEVGYQVRYDKKIGKNSSIKFMTDGILLRELQGDFLLKRYSVIILDEVHERSLRTDTLIGMLSRVIILRQKEYESQQEFMRKYSHLGKSIDHEKLVFPLKLVLMSATMPDEDYISYRELFRDPPRDINVSSRQFKVDIKFSRTTETDYINEAYKKVLDIHKNMPHGGILVFVTGYLEVEVLCQKLRKASRELTKKRKIRSSVTEVSELNSVGETNMKVNNKAVDCKSPSANHHVFSYTDEDQSEDDWDEFGSSYDTETETDMEIIGDDGDSLCQDTPENDGEVAQVLGEDVSIASLKASFEALAGKSSDSTSACKEPISCTLDACSNPSNYNRSLGKKDGVEDNKSPGSLHVLPLYSTLPAAAQCRVFEKVKEGERLVVVATNVAETSITIPGIKYVVDTGKVKSKEYNYSNGSEKYEVQWTSKASAIQRAGRAGRTGPGLCFRLYSSAAFNNVFDDRSRSEISKVPLDGLILLLKSMNIEFSAFPFPTPPADEALDGGVKCLKVLEALSKDGGVTPLGKAMAYYPISPRHSKMLLKVIQLLNKEHSDLRPNLLLSYAVASAAALSLSNIFVSEFEDSHTENQDLGDRKSSAPVQSDVTDKQETSIKRKKASLPSEHFSSCSSDALSRAYALRRYELSKSRSHFCKQYSLHPETVREMSELRKQLLKLVFYKGASGGEFSWIHGSMDDVERVWRADAYRLTSNEQDLLCRAICAGWADRVAKRIKGSTARYQACMIDETVHLNRRSSVFEIAPEYLVYSELTETKKTYMHGVTCIKPEWLVECRELCTFSKGTEPYYDPASDKVLYKVTPTYGRHGWTLPEHPLQASDLKGAVQAFAFALLDGKVLRCLKPVREFMAERPRTVLMSEAAGRERVCCLLVKMEEKRIHSCAILREVWVENPNKLLPEIRNWFRKSFHKNFKNLWVKMLCEALVS